LRGLAALLLVVGAATAFACAPAAAEQAATPRGGVVMTQPPKAIGDFELVDQEGSSFRFSRLRGRPALVFFGYTHCPDVCPATLVKLRSLVNAPASISDLEIVMISVDGDRDSPATLKAYLAQISPRFIGLTGDPRIVRGIAAQFPAVFMKGLPDHPGGPYALEHTSQVYLIDRQGRLRATFSDAPVASMEQVTRDVATSLRAGDPPLH
jgi:protein SCO1/2